MSRPGSKKRKLLFILEILVLLLFIGGFYVYGQISSRLDKIEQPVIDEEKILVNAEAPQMTGYTNYALFGVDRRDKNPELTAENSDTMIIASVNNDTKAVKLVSVYRDTFLNIGSDKYSKVNAAYAYGGAEQAISALNTNLDLDIKDYVTIDFNALTTVVDCLGGLDIPLSYAEIVHTNSYSKEVSKETGKSYTPLQEWETPPEDQEAIVDTFHLNGVQVTSYCRIRYTASMDMGRTERQRRVIQMIVSKAKSAGLTTIFDIMDEVFPMITTSVSKTEILSLIPAMIGYRIDETTGFPQNYKFSKVQEQDVIVPTTLDSNVIELHKFLYGDTGYVPSSIVMERSSKIYEIVDSAADGGSGASVTEEGTTEGTVLWTDDSSYESYDDGSYSDGSYDDGSYDDGSYDDGSYDDGSYDSGSYDDGSYDDGSYDNGSYDDGSYDDGSYDDGSYDDGSYDGGDYEGY